MYNRYYHTRLNSRGGLLIFQFSSTARTGHFRRMIDRRLNLNGHSTATTAQIYSRHRSRRGFSTLWPLQAYVDGGEWENKNLLVIVALSCIIRLLDTCDYRHHVGMNLARCLTLKRK